MLHELRNCKDIYELSDLLQIPAKTLTFLLYVLPDQIKYTSKCISKKGGGKRQLHVPEDRLKGLQRKLADVLYECQEDLRAKHGPNRSFGFERNRSIFDNAKCHQNKRWVFNVDIEDFFPTINFGRVISFFKKNNDFALHPKVATYIAQIACFQNSLPQGAPSSPVISNLVCGSLDYRLSRLASKNLCDYSRYADDITFSTNTREFPGAIAVADSTPQGWRASDELCSRIAASGFAINTTKTRMSIRGSRQMVTGLVVNHRPNVPREYYKQTRAAIHKLVNNEPFHVHRFCDPYRHNCEDQDVQTDEFSSLEGRISYCFGIHDKNDTRKDSEKFFNPSAAARSYADVLFFKYFIRGTKPILLTEGVSDVLYVKAALKSALAPIPNLVQIEPNGDRTLLLDFYRFAPRPSRLLGLSGGSGNLSLFFERYSRFIRRLNSSVARRPFIILLDNDDGLADTQARIKKLFGVDIAMKNDQDFYKLSDGCYIVKTPHIGSKMKTCIEDFLDPLAVGAILNGKTFSAKPDFDPSKHFGKVALSHHLYDQRANYSFASFAAILSRLSLASAMP